MNNIAVLEKTKEYVIIRVPREFLERSVETALTEGKALMILKNGMKEHKERKTKVLKSLRELRYDGN